MTNDHNPSQNRISRRTMLKTLGIGGVAVAAGASGGTIYHGFTSSSTADITAFREGTVTHVFNIATLLDLPYRQLTNDMKVYVGGYYEDGDGGGQIVRWVSSSDAEPNGGTVHIPNDGGGRPGRWLQIHNGTCDFRSFGIFDESQAADEALNAMISDETIHHIEAHTTLRFAKRHRLHRSHIDINFNGHLVITEGIAPAPGNDPFAAVLLFRGKEETRSQNVTLSADIPELSDVLQVQDASEFHIGDWWIARVNKLQGNSERELDKMLMVTEIVDATHIRVNYKLGWGLSTGRTISYKKVSPVVRAHIRNMIFEGAGNTDTSGSHPIAYEFAVECNVSGIEAIGTYWPVIMRRYCTHYVTERCRLTNPAEVLAGGTGYLTQQINCLYAHVKDCHMSNARHLNDFTGSAYGLVENCHGDGDDLGAFVTHGQYEHDLVYIGNSGLISFANSGPTWGESAKRITVKQHVGTRFIAHKKVTDLTLEDVHIVAKPGMTNSGSIWVNADGIQLKGCTAETMITFSQMSSRSQRANMADGCSFNLTPGYYISRKDVTSDITLQNCQLHHVDGNFIEGSQHLILRNTNVLGSSESARPLLVSCRHISAYGGQFHHSGILLQGNTDQTLAIGEGTIVQGTNADRAFLRSNNATGIVSWHLSSYSSEATTAETAHIHIHTGKNKYHAVGARFSSGQIHIEPEAFATDSYMLHIACIEIGVHRAAMPSEHANIQHSGGYKK